MSDVLTVDRLEVLVVVDNVTDSLSSSSNVAVLEWTGLLTAGRLQVLSDRAPARALRSLATNHSICRKRETHCFLRHGTGGGDLPAQRRYPRC